MRLTHREMTALMLMSDAAEILTRYSFSHTWHDYCSRCVLFTLFTLCLAGLTRHRTSTKCLLYEISSAHSPGTNKIWSSVLEMIKSTRVTFIPYCAPFLCCSRSIDVSSTACTQCHHALSQILSWAVNHGVHSSLPSVTLHTNYQRISVVSPC